VKVPQGGMGWYSRMGGDRLQVLVGAEYSGGGFLRGGAIEGRGRLEGDKVCGRSVNQMTS
jgi:hypothetical protein